MVMRMLKKGTMKLNWEEISYIPHDVCECRHLGVTMPLSIDLHIHMHNYVSVY